MAAQPRDMMRAIPLRLPAMRILLALLLVAASYAVDAAEARRYAILSLIGDRLLISEYVPPATPNGIESNTQNFVHLEDPSLEKTALVAVDEAIKKAIPTAKPVMLFAQDGRIYTAQERVLDEGGNSLHMLDYIRGLLMGQDVTHLILVTKVRQPARLQVDRAQVGSGVLEGLGFYVDATLPIKDTTTGKTGLGFVAPFAYFKVTLVDLANNKVVKEERVAGSTVVGWGQFTDTFNPWTDLPGERKVQLLQGVIRAEIARVVPRIVRQ
jgi:hypothetical protein